jgi:hypothetical protein
LPNLGDVVGTLLAGMSRARMRADCETIRIAEAYRNHELLRHMPVPRFRLPEVTFDLPLVIDSMSEDGMGQTPLFEAPPRTDLTATMRRAFAQSGLRPPVTQRRRLYALLHRKADDIFKESPNLLVSSQRFARELSDVAAKELKDVDAAKLAAITKQIRGSFSNLLVRRMLAAPELTVVVATGSVRDQGGDAVTRVSVRVSEDSMELAFDDLDDPTSARLVPE